MKITTGSCQGMKLSTAKGMSTRPTSEKVRQAVMNSLQHILSGCIFYDICAGSGAVGIEAISRGARGGVFIENDAAANKSLQLNLEELNRRFKAQDLEAPLLKSSSKSCLSFFKELQGSEGMKADIIWADPPYAVALDYLSTLAPLLLEYSNPEALLIWEIEALPKGDQVPSLLGWNFLRQKKYGKTMVLTWQKSEE